MYKNIKVDLYKDIFINTLFINDQKTILPLTLSLWRSSFLTLSLTIFFLPLCLRFTGDPPSLSHSTGSLRFTLSNPTSVQDSQLFPRSCVQAYMRATTLPAHICFDVQCPLVLMDLETENRIALVLLREAAEHRPNSRFLTATVLGVQQLCDILLFVEAIAAQEQENERLKRKSRGKQQQHSINEERNITHQSSSDKRLYLDDDDEIESFLRSLNKRGRGSVGPRMDETVPYLPTEKVDQLQSSDTRERKVRDEAAEVRGDIEFAVYRCNKSECLQEEWGVLEKSPEAALDVDQTIFVAVLW
ncbi:BnaC08g40760D [Brassica napus]|uniref:BnaC08g40760D protein n=1 Tax=Brassica napus TaxID=3708 RepID=A0A078FT94_BRANA|nr:BnaC08g40760D [Brassica napus]